LRSSTRPGPFSASDLEIRRAACTEGGRDKKLSTLPWHPYAHDEACYKYRAARPDLCAFRNASAANSLAALLIYGPLEAPRAYIEALAVTK
jgi:hypothetical protein